MTQPSVRPSSAAKERAWELLLEDTDLSLAIARNVWGGFQQLSQPDLVADWVEPYFDALDRVWGERSLDWTLEFSSGMFPHAAASQDLLDDLEEIFPEAEDFLDFKEEWKEYFDSGTGGEPADGSTGTGAPADGTDKMVDLEPVAGSDFRYGRRGWIDP